MQCSPEMLRTALQKIEVKAKAEGRADEFAATIFSAALNLLCMDSPVFRRDDAGQHVTAGKAIKLPSSKVQKFYKNFFMSKLDVIARSVTYRDLLFSEDDEVKLMFLQITNLTEQALQEIRTAVETRKAELALSEEPQAEGTPRYHFLGQQLFVFEHIILQKKVNLIWQEFIKPKFATANAHLHSLLLKVYLMSQA